MFGGDPFGDPFAQMRQMHQMHRQMDNMMNAMMQDTFGLLDGFMGAPRHPQQQMIDNGRGGGGHRGTGAVSRPRHPMDDMMLSPFGGFGLGGGLFGGIMQQMNHLQDHAMNDPNSVVFTQSTMISHDGTGQPRIVQQSTRKAGEVKETRRQVRNGMEDEEISVGHAIGDRAHVIEKKRDKDGRMRSQQRFINLDEDEAERFNNEFKSRASGGLGVGGSRSGSRYQAIDNGNNRRSGGRYTNAESSNSGPTPIVEIPDDDEDDNKYRNGSEPNPKKTKRLTRNHRAREEYYNNRDGPMIREISDEEADMSIPKRRKGLFGKFFNANDE